MDALPQRRGRRERRVRLAGHARGAKDRDRRDAAVPGEGRQHLVEAVGAGLVMRARELVHRVVERETAARELPRRDPQPPALRLLVARPEVDVRVAQRGRLPPSILFQRIGGLPRTARARERGEQQQERISGSLEASQQGLLTA